MRDGATNRSAIDGLIGELPELEEHLLETEDTVNEQVLIAKNKRSIEKLDGLETPLEDGDSIRLSPAAVGEKRSAVTP